MGNMLSIEFIEGQSATGKTTFIHRKCEKKSSSPTTYTEILSDPGDNSLCSHIFLRGDSSSDPLSILDVSQGGISLNYFFKMIESLTFSKRPNQRLLVDRSPLSLYVYEFWWKRLFPMIKDFISKNPHLIDQKDYPSVWIKTAMVRSSVVRECLSHFSRATMNIMVDMFQLACKHDIRMLVHLMFNDADDFQRHSLATDRRQKRGGIDIFKPQNSDMEKAFFLYTAGECLLWEELYKTYTTHAHLFDANKLQMKRVPFDAQGLIAAEEPFLLADV